MDISERNGLTRVLENRTVPKYSLREQLARVLWAVARIFFRFSPRPCFGWRNALLRLFGASIGKDVHVYGTAMVYMPWNLSVGDYSSIGEYVLVYNPGPVEIGERATVSLRAHICGATHDYNDPAMPLLKKGACIGDDAWICADAFVGPGVKVGEGAVVAARAVVVDDVAEWSVSGGNPARFIKHREMKR